MKDKAPAPHPPSSGLAQPLLALPSTSYQVSPRGLCCPVPACPPSSLTWGPHGPPDWAQAKTHCLGTYCSQTLWKVCQAPRTLPLGIRDDGLYSLLMCLFFQNP